MFVCVHLVIVELEGVEVCDSFPLPTRYMDFKTDLWISHSLKFCKL